MLPNKLRAVRLAAAEVFIAEGLQGTNWDCPDDPDRILRVAEAAPFTVRRWLSKRGGIDICVDERRGDMRVFVEPVKLGKLPVEQAAIVAKHIARAVEIARKVEAAIARAVEGSEA